MKTRDSAASTGMGGLRLVIVIGVAVAIGACAIGGMRALGAEAATPNEVTQTNGARHSDRNEGRPSSMLAVLNSGPQRATAAPADRSAMPGTTSSKAPSSAAPPTSDRGAVLFARQCALCHGDTGDGGGKFAYLMNPRPRNLQVGDFKLSTTENRIPSDSDLFRTISNGMPGSAMPPWDHLPQADIEALVAHVRQLHVDATRRILESWVEDGTIEAEELPLALAERTEPGPALKIPPEPPFDELRWFHGRRLYLQNCASCHGTDGEPVAEEVKYDAEGYPVPPRSFVDGIFKGGAQGHQLYARIWKGMKGTPMPSSEGIYDGDEMWDLIHYVQSLMRQGAQERAQLRQGTIVAPRISDALPADPMDATWAQTRPLYVGLTPLWWDEKRIEGLVVQAMHNGEELAIRLAWIDPTADDRAVRQAEFRDAVAIQFSLTSDPPFYMGSPEKHGGVNIWMWKADRETNLAKGFQDVDTAFPDRVVDRYPEQDYPLKDMAITEWPRAPITQHDPLFITAWGAGNLVANPQLDTPVECLVARGPGTLSGKPPVAQVVEGQAVYERGLWYVQLQRSMELLHDAAHGQGAAIDERRFRSGDYLPVSFAIWNGSAGDRDGKKNISIWQKLVIE